MELVEKAKQDYQAFEKLYEYYMPQIYGYLLSRVGNKEEAQDLTSHTFEKAVLGLHDYEVRDNVHFSSWLYRIAANNLTDYYRRAGKKKAKDLQDYENKLADEKSDQVENYARRDQIRQAVMRLPEEYQNIIALKFYQDLDNEEISEIIGVSYNNLGVKLYRGLKKLKEILSQDYE